MTQFQPVFKALLIACLSLAFVSVAQAQATRTWVASGGDDVNACSRTAPCRTFAGALPKTATNGEINCIDPFGFGAVTISKSITIDCHDVFASVLHAAITGVTINFDSFPATDTRKQVRLRNINFQGADTGLRAIRITGSASANTEVHVEDCLIDSSFGTPGRGIVDERSGGGKLFVTNTTIRNMGGTAISHAPATGSTRLDITIDNVRIFNCLFGVAVSSGGRMVITNSVITGCTTGLLAEGPAGASELLVDNVTVNNNATGIQQSAGGTIRIANSRISNSTTNGTSGTVNSFGNNRVVSNAGTTTLTAIGTDSHDKGQQ